MLSRTTDKSHKRLFARMLAQEMTLIDPPDNGGGTDPAGGTSMATSTSPFGDEDGSDYAGD